MIAKPMSLRVPSILEYRFFLLFSYSFSHSSVIFMSIIVSMLMNVQSRQEEKEASFSTLEIHQSLSLTYFHC